MIGMLSIHHLRHYSRRNDDCAIILFRRRTHDRRPALCNCSNADMQSTNDKTLSAFVLDEKINTYAKMND